jgi:lipopolysaccharide transport system ATP-binding protein
MSNTAITIENISKCYLVGHKSKQTERYTALRDVLVQSMGSFYQKSKDMLHGRPLIIGDEIEEFWALKGVNLEINIGDRIGIVGRNGAGKSTLLKILSRITDPTKGKITMRGRVSSLLEVGTGFNSELTGRENIFLNGAILGMTKNDIKARFDEIVEFAQVEQFLDTPVKRYSSGMFVRLAFAVAAHLEPEILIVDEVLAVGDLNFRNKCLGKMKEIGQSGRTIIFVSHDMSTVRQLCDRAVIMGDGQVLDTGTTEEITRKYEKASQELAEDRLSTVHRKNGSAGYHFSKVELRNAEDGQPSTEFQAGDTIEIHLWASEKPPADSFTIEFYLFNEKGDRISFGAANPVRDHYYSQEDMHYICKIGPLPLTSGVYSISFSARVWGLERWDDWEHAIEFSVYRCDPYKTGFDQPSGVCGDFVLGQEWSATKSVR